MSGNTIGRSFCVTTFGESHGPAIGAIVDGCPPGLELSEADIQSDLEARRTGKSQFTSQRQEPDRVRILSGVFEGRTTGTAIGLLVDNVDARERDYGTDPIDAADHPIATGGGCGVTTQHTGGLGDNVAWLAAALGALAALSTRRTRRRR